MFYALLHSSLSHFGIIWSPYLSLSLCNILLRNNLLFIILFGTIFSSLVHDYIDTISISQRHVLLNAVIFFTTVIPEGVIIDTIFACRL